MNNIAKIGSKGRQAISRGSIVDSQIQDLLDIITSKYPNNLSTISNLWDHDFISSTSYPPYNIEYGENKGDYIIEIALAGFTKDDLEVEFLKDQKLTVRSKTQSVGEKEEADVTRSRYVKKGIGKRDFSVAFSIPQYSVVKSCEMQDGLLIIDIRRELPEEKKPKMLDIK